MRYASLLFVLVTTIARSASVGPDGIDSLQTGLTGSGILIGEADLRRSAKAGYDPANHAASNTDPAGVYFQNDPGMADPDAFLDEHATLVAQIMIGDFGLFSGVAEDADLHSIGISDLFNDVRVALALNRLALLSGGEVKAINISFGTGIQGPIEHPDGNSHMTLFVDWSAREHDLLYVVAWGNIESPDEFRKPQDNFNGLTVASSEKVDTGSYRKFSQGNKLETDTSDAQRIDILAPGQDILVLRWGDMPDTQSGTSLAAPHVTGTAALLQQYAKNQMDMNPPNPRFDPDSQRHEVMKAVILNSADKLEGVHGSTRDVVDRFDQDWTQSEASNNSSIPLDDEIGVGHLNARRAVQQFESGEYDPGMVPSVGWDFHTAGGPNDYIFDSEIGGGYLAATLVWDRRVEKTSGGNYLEGDMFINEDPEDRLNNLDLYLMPANSNDLMDAIAVSNSEIMNIEHIFFDIPSAGEYKLVVVNNPVGGIGDNQEYALAWWFGNPTTVTGDYDGNGSVGHEDYNLWKANFGSMTELAADGNGDGIVDAADYTVWRDNLGAGTGSGLAAVPEPSTLALFMFAGLVIVAWAPSCHQCD